MKAALVPSTSLKNHSLSRMMLNSTCSFDIFKHVVCINRLYELKDHFKFAEQQFWKVGLSCVNFHYVQCSGNFNLFDYSLWLLEYSIQVYCSKHKWHAFCAHLTPFHNLANVAALGGRIGCYESHRAVIRQAYKDGLISLLIFEDDVCFNKVWWDEVVEDSGIHQVRKWVCCTILGLWSDSHR